MKYAAQIEYDGSQFSGWQKQKHQVRTVQQCLEKALSKVANHSISITTAGRTDTGVHATHQIVHFDSDAKRDENSWCQGTNRFLDHDIRVRWVASVNDDFHARFSAQNRSYRFIIHNAPTANAILRNYSTPEYRVLDVEKMRRAGDDLIGKHDFSSFRAAGCQANSPVRTVQEFSLSNYQEWVWFDIKANAFLQHMVRNIAGALIEIGYAKRDDRWIDYLLRERDRTKGSITAPPNGLYLTGVEYSDEYKLPSRSKLITFW